MKEAVSFPATGGSVLIEVEDARGLKTVATGAGRVVKEAEASFESALDSVKGLASSFHASLTDSANRPNAVTVEFSVKLSATAGVIIASGSGEANFKIALTWND